MGSPAGPGGRTPRRTSSRRLYRALRAGTDTSSVSPDRAQDGALSRRRRTYIQVYPLHYSPRFVECPRGYAAPTLFGGMDRPVVDIECRPESQRTCQGDSLARRAGRTPRRRSPRRLYRALRAATDTSSVPPSRAQDGALSRRRRTYIRVYHLSLQSPVRGVSVSRDGAYAPQSDG